jgi:hypothetical protein
VSSAIIYQGASQETRGFDIKSRVVIRWNKFRQIFISYHLATGECPFTFRSDERLSGCFNSLPSSHSYPAYEMKQISADFHLISRLSGSHLNCHSYKSH